MLTSKNSSAGIKTFEIMKVEGSLIFYHAGIKAGLFRALEQPLKLEQIALKLNIKNVQLLSSLLDMGCSLKEITCKNERFRLKGSMDKALATNIPLIKF